ncbi:conserved membrane protein [Heliomicrobium modesticaldum Ice1]|uniref:Conserved membrane protein n=1 Tax=Heliobacterium modesticaldum (strain ATCC 51547 / Ice1) TaxID=498761 RepID=B0TFA1_HELMI|nr:ECF transporter S component [Heliomicrobium modesticaldum]ABZ84418.1 conserved membrane protein [Heliomicrobium modesticaldum Ice1]
MWPAWPKLQVPLILALAAGSLFASLIGRNIVGRQGWGLLALEMVFLALLLLFWAFERKEICSRELAMIAVLGALAAVGRIPFSALMGIQPVTFLTVLSGAVFGPRAGFMVGATAALVSNFFLGQGPWTPWQMFSWGMAGLSAGLLTRFFPDIGRLWMLAFLFAWGYLYGWIMNFWHWSAFVHPHTGQSFLLTYLASLSFDTVHAIGNCLFYALFGKRFTMILQRFRNKLQVAVS